MKNSSIIIALLLSTCICTAQQMHVKQFNFQSFRATEKSVSQLQNNFSTAQEKAHPEFGLLPFNAPCKNCFEQISKRSANARLFSDEKNVGHTYSQQSYFPLHYKKKGESILRTIDHRLSPEQSGVYSALNQPVPTRCNLNTKTTSLLLDDFEFVFNQNLSLYFIDSNVAETTKAAGEYSSRTVGEEGLEVKNMWAGITMQQLFKAGSIKTNYVIDEPLNLPIQKGWMVIEDHFSLPDGFTCEKANGRTQHSPEDYVVINAEDRIVAVFERPVYLDAYAYGQHGHYELSQSGNEYALKMIVPIDWLKRPDNHYPITIDPTVSGFTKIGDFTSSGLSAQLGFSSVDSFECAYTMNVSVPGRSELTNAYVNIEYTLTYDNTCGNPPLPPPFCTFSQVGMRVKSDSCNVTTNLLACNPALPPYTGTCTTNPLLVPGASAMLINNSHPLFLSCYEPQCPDYSLPFTIYNTDSICGDVCGYLCARGNMWQMTVEAMRVEGFITIDTITINSGDFVIATAHPSFGVPPYTYLWTTNGGLSFDTTQFPITNFTLYNPTVISCMIVDACGEFYFTNDLSVDVLNPIGFENESTSSSKRVTLYPNPTNQKLLLKSDDLHFERISITGTDGRLVMKSAMMSEIDVSTLSAGVYLIRLEGNYKTEFLRFFKY